MNTKLKALFAAILGLGLFAALPAQATVLSSYLTFDGPRHTVSDGSDTTPGVNQGGGEDAVIDDSLTQFVDLDGSGGFSDGDVVWGIVTISEVDSSGAPSIGVGANNQVAFVFSAFVNVGGTNGGDFSLTPVDDGGIYDLDTILGALAVSTDGDTIAVGLSTTTGDANPADDPLNATAADILGGWFVTEGWDWELTLGLVADTDFFDFAGDSTTGGDEAAMFTIQDQAFAAEWLPVDVEDYNLNPVDGDFAFSGDVNLASDDQLLAGWNFADDSRALVNPIPAPGTLALLALGLFGIRAAQKKIVS